MKGVVLDGSGLLLNDDDTVITVVDDLEAGTEIAVAEAETGGGTTESITLATDVAFGHKIALVPIEAGDPVLKYGERIGVATVRIAAGDWVHTHNCESTRGRGDRTAADGGRPSRRDRQ